MIYIFDDRHERREMNSSLINRYNRLISFAEIKCDTFEQLDHFISNELFEPSLVLLHNSYRYPGDRLDSDYVSSKFLEHDIPLILFSGGFIHPNQTLVYGKYQALSINSLVMYKNLDVYLKHLTYNENASIEILLWGESYISNRISHTKSAIFRKICKVRPDSSMDEDMCQEIHEIISDYLSGDELVATRKRFLDAISSSINCQEFLNTIKSF